MSNSTDYDIISKHKLYPSADQPRKHIPSEVIEKRRKQLESEGQLTPLLIFPADSDGNHEIIDGECRWRGGMASDVIEDFKVEIYKGDRDDIARIITVQLMRNDDGATPLTAPEKAKAYQRLVDSLEDDDEKGSALKQAADRMGMDYSEFTRALKVGEMSEDVTGFVLERGIDDKRVINGLMRIERLATKNKFDEVLDEIRDNDAKKERNEKAHTTREIVSSACKDVKGGKQARGAKEKVKRKLSARKITFKVKNDTGSLVIETPREVITFDLESDQAEKFKGLDLSEVEPETHSYEL